MSVIIRLISVPAEIFEAGCRKDILMDSESTVAKMVAAVPATALTLAFAPTAVKLAGSSTNMNPLNGIECSHVKSKNMVLLPPASSVPSVIVELVILPGTRTTCGMQKSGARHTAVEMRKINIFDNLLVIRNTASYFARRSFIVANAVVKTIRILTLL